MYLLSTSSCCKSQPQAILNPTDCQKYAWVTDIVLSLLMLAAAVYVIVSQQVNGSGWNSLSYGCVGAMGIGLAVIFADWIKRAKSSSQAISDEQKRMEARERVRQLLEAPMATYEERLNLVHLFCQLYPDLNRFREYDADFFGGQETKEEIFQKTVQSLICILMIKKGDYEGFIAAQKPDAKDGKDPVLDQVSFQALKTKILKELENDEAFDFLCTLIVLRNQGKLLQMRKQWAIEEQNPIQALYEGLKKGGKGLICFQRLDKTHQNLALRVFSAGFNGTSCAKGEMCHQEIIPIVTMLRSNQDSDRKIETARYILASELLIFMGDFIDENPRYNGSSVYRQNAFYAFNGIGQHFFTAGNEDLSSLQVAQEACRNFYLSRLRDFVSWSADAELTLRAQNRIGTMLGLCTQQEVQKLEQAMSFFDDAGSPLIEIFVYDRIKFVGISDFLKIMYQKEKLKEGLDCLVGIYSLCTENQMQSKNPAACPPAISLQKLIAHVRSIRDEDGWNFRLKLDKKKMTIEVEK